MHLPSSSGFKYIVQGRCSLTHYPEWKALRKENSQAIGEWILMDIITRWGALREIVTDNGGPFVKALEYLAKKYGINHIRISGYNSRANGIVERSHFDVRQALYKSAGGIENRWLSVAPYVFWSERVTVRRRMGCSPYYAATGTVPLLPIDIVEASYLQPPPESVLSTTDLVAHRVLDLQKRGQDLHKLHQLVSKARIMEGVRFQERHKRTIHEFNFTRGNLVLMRNTKVEKSLNRKMRPRYLGPLVVVSRNKGGAYILCELDGSVLHQPVAAFRLLPYLARRNIALPDEALDIDTAWLREMEASDILDDDDYGPLEELQESDEEDLNE